MISGVQPEAPDTPLYVRIKRHILDKVERGVLKPGDKVPSEHALMREFGVSRMTAHRALRELKDAGVLRSVMGVGTFIATAKPQSNLITLKNIAEEIRGRGHEYHADVIQNKREKASPKMADRLGLATGSQVFHSIIVHREAGIPIQLENRYVVASILPDYGELDFNITTPNEYLMKAALLQRVEHRVRAVLPTSESCRLLEIKPEEPCLLVTRRTWSQQRIVSLARLVHPGSRFEFKDIFEPDG